MARVLRTRFSASTTRQLWLTTCSVSDMRRLPSLSSDAAADSSSRRCCFLIRDLRAESRFDSILFLFFWSTTVTGMEPSEAPVVLDMSGITRKHRTSRGRRWRRTGRGECRDGEPSL